MCVPHILLYYLNDNVKVCIIAVFTWKSIRSYNQRPDNCKWKIIEKIAIAIFNGDYRDYQNLVE